MSERVLRPAFPAFGAVTAARISIALVGALLVLLPFERQLGLFPGPAGLSITGLEIIWALCLVAWTLRLVVERRLPQITRGAAVALLGLLAVNLASALTSDGHTAESVRFVARSAAGWLLFVVVADALSNGASARRQVACLLAGAAVSAAIGLAASWLGPSMPEVLRSTSNVGSIPRLQGSFNFANTAAMYWTATAIAGVGLAAVTRSRLSRGVVVAVVVAIAAISLLTLSRGSALGVCGGLATSAVVLFLTGRRRGALLTLLAGAGYAVATIGVQLVMLPGGHLFSEGQQSLYAATYGAPAIVEADPGETIRVPVSVTNHGDLTWRYQQGRQYSVGAAWIDVEHNRRIGRTKVSAPITTNVEPGQTVSIEAEVAVPSETGIHIAGWDVVTPAGGRLADYGNPVLTTMFLVGGAQAPEGVEPQRELHLVDGRAYIPSRAELWRAATLMVAEKPLLGVGPGTFRLRYGSYLDIANPDERIHSNNFVLELAASTGLLGLAAFAILVGYVVLRVIRSIRRTILLVFILGAISAFFWAGLVDYFLGFMGNAGLFWALLGLGLGLATRRPTVSAEGGST